MTDERHVDETMPEQTMPSVSNNSNSDLTDLPIQPTGSGAVDLELAKLQAAVADGTPDAEIETGIANENAAYDRAMRDDNAPAKTQA